MFDSLQRARKTLPGGTGLSERDVTFLGFDGNNETALMAYARYIVEAKERYDYLLKTPDLNSHMSVVETYKRMLKAYEKSDNPRELTAEDIKRIKEARVNPKARQG